MSRTIIGAIVGVALGFGGTFYYFEMMPERDAMSEHLMDGSDASHDRAEMEAMAHPMTEVAASAAVPTITLRATKDTKNGYNIHVLTQNYTFTPEHVGEGPIENEGHAHIYVNDVLLMRMYGPWVNIPESALREGDNVIEVTLNANDHSEWVLHGEHIAAQTILEKQ